MAKVSKTAFKSNKDLRYADNTTAAITPLTHRDQFEEVADSFTIESPAEAAYWKDKAALLDPNAYTFYTGATWTQTVPVGETWYALNLWHVETGTTYLFQRVNDSERPLILPEGTTIKADGTQAGFAYICKPASVFSDSRYTNDPRGLYYERLNRLRTMVQHDLAAVMPAGQAWNYHVSTAFPTDFDRGLVVLVSSHDVSWTTMDNDSGGMNTLSEISDKHQIRFAEVVSIPFKRLDFPRIKVRSARESGDAADTGLAGEGAVKYFKLPTDW